MTGITCLPRLTTAALLAAAFVAAPAMGQYQVQDGAAHDANQQVGSGGYNPGAEQPDYSTRNLLITGQVGGGRSFQGSIDYSAAGEFQGSLGSDSLFNFQRDSVYSAPGGASFSARQYGDRVIVTRPTSSIPGYGYGAGYALSGQSTYDPNSGTLSFRQAGGGLVAISGLTDTNALRSAAGNSLGLIRTPQGIVSIDASPLTGISYNPLDVNTGLRDLTPQVTTPKLQPDPEELTTNPLDLSPERTIQGTPATPSIEEPGTDLLDLPEDPLTVTLGMQVQSAMALQIAGRVDNNIPNAQALAIRNQLFAQAQQLPIQPEAAPQAPKNPYDQIIADILAQSKGQEPAVQPDVKPEEDKRPRWQQILEEPDQAVLDAKMKSREVAMRISLGMVDAEGNVDFTKELPTIDADSELGKLLKDLDYDLPRVNTLAGQDENRINTLLTRGEQELKAGRYTISESVYRQVLRESGDNPLAKAGLIHSQMGAGMIRSAAFNLRGLFSDHPELIALRYDTNLLPDTERLRWLQGQIQKQIADENPGSEPGLILAYLGYQLEAPPLIEFGLSTAEAQAPRDPLMPVLRRIWLEGENNKDQDAKEDKPADAAPDANK